MEHIEIKTLNRKGQERTGAFVLSPEASIGLAERLYFILFLIYIDSGVLNCNAVLTSSGLKMKKLLFSQTFVSNYILHKSARFCKPGDQRHRLLRRENLNNNIINSHILRVSIFVVSR
jgi:hypothetical protein